jgi:hypothetical protein
MPMTVDDGLVCLIGDAEVVGDVDDLAQCFPLCASLPEFDPDLDSSRVRARART